VWLFVHIVYLVEFEHRLLVLVQWAWYYVTRHRGTRLITGESPLPLPITTSTTRLPAGDRADEELSKAGG
jgi:NADH dehydrogenase